MTSKTVYQTNDAGFYTHDEEAQQFPFAEGEYNIPFGAVMVTPPAREAGFRARWTSSYAREARLFSTKGKWIIEAIPVDLHVIDSDGRYLETIVSSVPDVGPNLEHLPANRVLIAPPAAEDGHAAFWISKFSVGTPEFATLGQWRLASIEPLPDIPPPAPDPDIPVIEPTSPAEQDSSESTETI